MKRVPKIAVPVSSIFIIGVHYSAGLLDSQAHKTLPSARRLYQIFGMTFFVK